MCLCVVCSYTKTCLDISRVIYNWIQFWYSENNAPSHRFRFCSYKTEPTLLTKIQTVSSASGTHKGLRPPCPLFGVIQLIEEFTETPIVLSSQTSKILEQLNVGHVMEPLWLATGCLVLPHLHMFVSLEALGNPHIWVFFFLTALLCGHNWTDHGPLPVVSATVCDDSGHRVTPLASLMNHLHH